MKHNLFLTTMLAVALLGGQAFAEPVVYKVSECPGLLDITATEAMIIVDAQKSLVGIESAPPECLTLDYQGDFELIAKMIRTPVSGVLNITTTVDSVASAWEETFSVAEGDSITLCSPGMWGSTHGPVQFFGKDKDSTVKLGDSEVKFMGVVADLSALDMNQVGVVWGDKDMLLVGKIGSSPVPEPTTGTLSLLALAGLCASRRRK